MEDIITLLWFFVHIYLFTAPPGLFTTSPGAAAQAFEANVTRIQPQNTAANGNPAHVPKGHGAAAQGFNLGNLRPKDEVVPKGRLSSQRRSNIPPG
jgi:hypothetical protein